VIRVVLSVLKLPVFQPYMPRFVVESPPSLTTLTDTNCVDPKSLLLSLMPLLEPEATTDACTPVMSVKVLIAAAMLAIVVPEVCRRSRS
jgi:hypothetical protein